MKKPSWGSVLKSRRRRKAEEREKGKGFRSLLLWGAKHIILRNRLSPASTRGEHSDQPQVEQGSLGNKEVPARWGVRLRGAKARHLLAARRWLQARGRKEKLKKRGEGENLLVGIALLFHKTKLGWD